jgi:hypothetical protein
MFGTGVERNGHKLFVLGSDLMNTKEARIFMNQQDYSLISEQIVKQNVITSSPRDIDGKIHSITLAHTDILNQKFTYVKNNLFKSRTPIMKPLIRRSTFLEIIRREDLRLTKIGKHLQHPTYDDYGNVELKTTKLFLGMLNIILNYRGK